jgi:hypothetical protein
MAQPQAATAAAEVNIANALEAKKEKTTMMGRLSKKQRCALIRGSTVDYNTEPTTVTASCERLYEASSHHASYAELQDLMMRSNATYRYSPTHLENTTKVGVIWLDISIPEHVTVFAAFPLEERATKIQNDVLYIDHQRREQQKLNDANLNFLRKFHLFCPSNLLEATQSLRNYSTLLSILFGEHSILHQGLRHIWSFFE